MRMVGPSKILTVSYGTFSCTLEGFDEPFNTMKAIAEYFRDLAAEDRYFGAEPPTPDAEMLHRIAEREIKRRVEAQVQDNGVILRPQIERVPTEAADAPADEARFEVASEPAAQVQPRKHPTSATAGVAVGAALAAAPDVTTVSDGSDDGEAMSGISAKLQRIRAAVAQVRAHDEAGDDDGARDRADEGRSAGIAATDPVGPIAEPSAEDDSLVIEPVVTRLSPEAAAQAEAERARAARRSALDAARAEAQRQASEEAARAEAERQSAEEAARAEAERQAAEEAARAEAERQAAEEAARAEAERQAAEEAARAEAERQAAEEAARAEAERQAAETEEDLQTPVEARSAVERPQRRVVVVRPQQRSALAGTPADSVENAAVQAALEAARATTPPPLPSGTQATDSVESNVADSVHAAMATFAAEDVSGLADEDEAPVQDAHRRQARMPEADIESLADEDEETAVSTGTSAPAGDAMTDHEETLSDAELQNRVAEALGETGLPPEAEAELLAELTAVEREAEAARRDERLRRAALRDEGADAAADRLARDADSQFSNADAQRRQSTISHLKAAVVATRAEEEAGEVRSPEVEEEREIARYRADLEQTVQRPGSATPSADDGMPRRPVRGGAQRSERPRNAQPPLVLVSEQRIDRPTETEIIQPRRINTGALAMEELYDEEETAPAAPQGRAFTDFVTPMHLTTLAELTEAAAAYVTEVEGVEEFTRPQVMRHVSATGLPMARSRENMLRTFGLLMRQGTMSRANRGQYALARDSEFREQARRFASGG